MNFKELHTKFKDDDSPSVEGQIRWLQKQGFAQHQIEQAMIAAYTEIEMGRIPNCWSMLVQKNGGERIDRKYLPADYNSPGHKWKSRPIKNGFEFDQFLLENAKKVRTDELSVMLKNMQQFEKKLKKKWSSQVPWYKRMFGIKPVDEQ